MLCLLCLLPRRSLPSARSTSVFLPVRAAADQKTIDRSCCALRWRATTTYPPLHSNTCMQRGARSTARALVLLAGPLHVAAFTGQTFLSAGVAAARARTGLEVDLRSCDRCRNGGREAGPGEHPCFTDLARSLCCNETLRRSSDVLEMRARRGRAAGRGRSARRICC